MTDDELKLMILEANKQNKYVHSYKLFSIEKESSPKNNLKMSCQEQQIFED